MRYAWRKLAAFKQQLWSHFRNDASVHPPAKPTFKSQAKHPFTDKPSMFPTHTFPHKQHQKCFGCSVQELTSKKKWAPPVLVPITRHWEHLMPWSIGPGCPGWGGWAGADATPNRLETCGKSTQRSWHTKELLHLMLPLPVACRHWKIQLFGTQFPPRNPEQCYAPFKTNNQRDFHLFLLDCNCWTKEKKKHTALMSAPSSDFWSSWDIKDFESRGGTWKKAKCCGKTCLHRAGHATDPAPTPATSCSCLPYPKSSASPSLQPTVTGKTATVVGAQPSPPNPTEKAAKPCISIPKP